MIGDEMNLPRDGSTLSATGAARSEAIRSAVLSAAGTRRRRRVAVRTAGTLAVVLVACGAVALTMRGGAAPLKPETATAPQPAPAPVPETAPTPAPAPTAVAANTLPKTMILREIGRDATIVQRLGVGGPALSVREIGDDELIALVERTGNRYGLERIGERVRMICLDCAPGFKGLGSGGDSGGGGGGTPSTN